MSTQADVLYIYIVIKHFSTKIDNMGYLDIVGDLINSVQKFTDLVGWKEAMKELITKEEGSFVLVCTGDRENTDAVVFIRNTYKFNILNCYLKSFCYRNSKFLS